MKDKYYDYIDGVDLDNIEYVHYNYLELMSFLYNNYYDYEEEKFIVNDDSINPSIYGMHYLGYEEKVENEYILAISKNNKGLYTIIGMLCYINNHKIIIGQKRPITYFYLIEVNKYFRENGIFKKLVENACKYISFENPIIISLESTMGKCCNVTNKTIELLRNNGFNEDIRSEDSRIDDDYINYLKSDNKKVRR